VRKLFARVAIIILFAGCLSGRQNSPQLEIWATGESKKIHPDTSLEIKNYHWDGISSTISIKAARNEYIGCQLILRSPRELQDVSLDISPLTSKNLPALIPVEEIHCYRELYINVEDPTDRAGSTGAGEYPDPLIPFYDPYSSQPRKIALPITLEEGRNLPIWIDIRVPDKIPPGEYRGVISVLVGKRIVKNINLSLEVWGFTLPDQPSLMVFFDLYGWRWARGEGLPWRLCDETWEVLSRYEIMAHEHGFSNGHWGLMPANAASATMGVDWTLYDRYFGQVIDGSLFADGKPPACWELPFPEGWDPGDEVLEAYCKELVKHWDEKGWNLETCFAYVWDELGPGNPRVRSYGEVLKKASSGRINYFYTCPPSPALFGVVDWWAPRASAYNPAIVKKRQQLGEKGFFYHAGEPSVGLMCIDADGLAFRTWSWLAWIYGCSGFFDWAANFWSEDPYHDPLSFDTDNGNMYLFYPGRGLETLGLPMVAGPIPSFRLKALRRGLQDYEYFRLAREANLLFEPTIRLVVRKGLGITGAYGIDPQAWSREPRDWYRARDAIGKMLDNTLPAN